MAAIESYDDVRGLGEPELRGLLERGRPEQRVWALWALALRSAENVGEIARRHEPDPGVRRNLAVVLAGHGELELLVALARRDPAPEVRGAALALCARLAATGRLPVSLVVERAMADAPEVQIAVLGTIFEHPPRWQVELAIRLLAGDDSDVRYEAFEALLRAGEHSPALMWLEEAPELEARIALMKWTARGRVRPCAELIASGSRRLRRLLVESVRIATWRDLGPAIGDDPHLLRALDKRDPQQLAEVPLEPLLRATLRDPDDRWLGEVVDRLVGLEHPPELPPQLLDQLAELCMRRIADLDRRLRDVRDAPDSPPRDLRLRRLVHARGRLERAVEVAMRLRVH
ncbi:MAG TPA: hypothetical protein VLX92_18160 [Kofleriaceae bacterium]|nr:hypothetical protein [Kofleriaceae bacterium]